MIAATNMLGQPPAPAYHAPASIDQETLDWMVQDFQYQVHSFTGMIAAETTWGQSQPIPLSPPYMPEQVVAPPCPSDEVTPTPEQ